jgi:hypothetical protein
MAKIMVLSKIAIVIADSVSDEANAPDRCYSTLGCCQIWRRANLAAGMFRKFELNQSLANFSRGKCARLLLLSECARPANDSAIGVASQTVGKFATFGRCKEAAGQTIAGTVISDLSISREDSWY